MADEIVVRVRAEGTEKFVSDLKKTGASVEDVGEKTTQAEQKIVGSFKKIGIAAAAAFSTAAIVQFIKTATKAADEQIKNEAKLLNALRGREKQQQRLIQQAQQLQKESIFGDEVIIEQQAFLAALGLTEKQINKVIKAAIDLSAGANISLESSVRNLAKTYSGLSGELGELVLPLRDLSQEQLKAGKGVELVAKLYAGAGQTLATAGLGPVKQLQNSFGDLTEEFGKGVTEGLIPLAEGFKRIISNRAVVGLFTSLGKAIGNVVGVAGAVVSSLGDLLSLLPGIRIEVDRLKDELPDLGQEILDTFKPLEGEILTIEDKVQKFVENIATFTVEDLKNVKETIEQNLIKVTQDYNQAVVDNDELIADLSKGSMAIYEEALEAIELRLKGVIKKTDDLDKKTWALIRAFNQASKLIATDEGSIGERLEELQEIFTETISLAEQFQQQLIGGNQLAISEGTQKLLDQLKEQNAAARSARAEQQYADEQAAKAAEERLQREQEIAEARVELQELALSSAFDITNSFYDRELQALKRKNEQGIISDKEYDRQRKEIQRKQAVADKAGSAFGVIVNTAQGITKTIAQVGLPAAFPLIALASAIGALQLATVLAEPIPQFAKGTKGQKRAPKGFAWVGEEGPELVQLRGGENIFTAGDSEELMKLLASYGVPAQFSKTSDDLYKPLKSIENITRESELAGLDWGPLLNASDIQRRSLGKKLDQVNLNLVRMNHGLTRRMTRN